MTDDLKNYTLGRGKIYFDPFLPNTTTKTGERYLGNTTEFNLAIESDQLDHFGSDEGVREKDDSVLLELNRTGTITTDNINEENVKLFILGDVSEITQTATPVTGESLGAALPDRYYQLGTTTANPSGVRGISSVTVTYDPGGAGTVLTENTDYTIDLSLGRIYFIDGGAVDGQADVEVDYTPDANTRKQMITNASASITGALRFVSFNPKGKQKDVYMPSVTLTPSGDWALKGDDWQQMSFNVEIGKLETGQAIYVDSRPVV